MGSPVISDGEHLDVRRSTGQALKDTTRNIGRGQNVWVFLSTHCGHSLSLGTLNFQMPQSPWSPGWLTAAKENLASLKEFSTPLVQPGAEWVHRGPLLQSVGSHFPRRTRTPRSGDDS